MYSFISTPANSKRLDNLFAKYKLLRSDGDLLQQRNAPEICTILECLLKDKKIDFEAVTRIISLNEFFQDEELSNLLVAGFEIDLFGLHFRQPHPSKRGNKESSLSSFDHIAIMGPQKSTPEAEQVLSCERSHRMVKKSR